MLFPSALERLGRRVPARGGPSPVMQSATVPATGATISLLFSTPVSFGGGGSGGFTLSLTGGAVTMTYQSGSGTATLVYSLSRVLQAGETGSISFTQPGNGVEATAGGADVTSFSLVTLVNNSTQVPPTHTTTAINTAGTQVSLGFSGTVSFGAGGNGGFVLTMSGGASAMTYVSGNGTSTLVYSLARVIDTGETGTLAYTQPGNGVESSVTTLDVVSFSGHSVTNNSSQRPTLVSATINSAGTSIALLFSKSVSFGAGGNSGLMLSMTGGAVTASYASGGGSTTLTYGLSRTIYQGETGTTSYTQPGSGIEASASGADVSSFSGATVSNGSTAQPTNITLSNLPPATTTQTSVSIGYELTPSDAGTTYFRRDAFSPVAAPASPIVMGTSTPLAAGVHTVDFYVSVSGDGSDINPAAPLASHTWEIIQAATITLSNLPVNPTAETGASIGWTLSPSGSGTVYWRRDGGSPAVMAVNPIVLSSLSVGSHTIDFYISVIGDGSDIVLGSPAATYSWTISASGVTPLASLPLNVPATEMGPEGSYGAYADGATITLGGVTKLSKVTDPGGSGIPVYLHRVARTGGNPNGSNIMQTTTRSEKLWLYSAPQGRYFPGDEVWMAFGVRFKSDEIQTSFGGSPDGHIVFQTHCSSSGDTTPDLSIYLEAQAQKMYFQRSWSSGSDHADGVSLDYQGAWPTMSTWYKWIIRWKLGYLTSHAPATQAWLQIGNGALNQVVNKIASTDFNTYNYPSNGSYLRIGIYKWSGNYWQPGLATIANYSTTLYAEKGTDLLERAKASLAGL